MAKRKVENYYKILGTRSNIKQENIKKKYIEMVKQFPPETHPEEFERIREAYEVLRDPKKRREYDIMRKYGNKIEKLMERAEMYAEEEQWEQAQRLYQDAVNMMPESIPARIGLAHATLFLGDLEGFEAQCADLVSIAPEGMEVRLYMVRASMYVEVNELDKARQVFMEACERYPDRIHETASFLVSAYFTFELDHEAWDLLVSILPQSGQERPEHMHLFILWVHTMARLNKWDLWSQVQGRTRKFLKSLSGEEAKQMVLAALDDQVEMLYEASAFRLCEIFVDFMYILDSKNIAIREKRAKIQRMMRLEKEMGRLRRDFELFPLIVYEAQRYFMEQFFPEERVPELEEDMPPDLLSELQEMDMEYLAGIQHVKKKYPLIYKEFKDKWERLYAEHAEGLNREARRKFR
jgi:tetratricopeptide (TPR) repeat protein